MAHDVRGTTGPRAARIGVVRRSWCSIPFHGAPRPLDIQSGYFGLRDNRAWIDEVMHNLDAHLQGRRSTMRALSGG